MALDESKDEDSVSEEGGIKFLMDSQTTDILRQSGGLTIDYVDESHRRGYMLRLGETAGDCSSSGGGGGCNGCG